MEDTPTEDAAQKACIETFEQLNMLEMTVDLLERLDQGAISAKELDNEAGPIRIKLSNARASLSALPHLDQSLDERRAEIVMLQDKISRQTALLEKFKSLIKDTMENTMES